MTKKKKKNHRGFTLVEMLVIIFILAVISSTLVVNWRKNEKRYVVQRAAQKMVQNIRRAQDMALSGKKYQAQVPDSAYGVYFNKNNKTSYIIFGDKNNNNAYQPSDILVETMLLDPDIEIYSLSNEPNLNVCFSIPDGFVAINPSSTTATIGIRKTNSSCPSNFCKSIIIKNTGQINIQ